MTITNNIQIRAGPIECEKGLPEIKTILYFKHQQKGYSYKLKVK